MSKPHKHAEILRAIADGVAIQIRGPDPASKWEDWQQTVHWSPLREHNCIYRIKPETPKYPQTRMTDAELTDALHHVPHTSVVDKRGLANVAIARAIEDGDVITTEKSREWHEGACAIKMAGMVPDAMLRAVAREVIAWHRESFRTRSLLQGYACPTATEIAAIIERVKGGAQ